MSRAGSSPGGVSDSDDESEDELKTFIRTQRRLTEEQCPNPIKWWLDRQAQYPNLSKMALDYLIIPSEFTQLPIAFSVTYDPF